MPRSPKPQDAGGHREIAAVPRPPAAAGAALRLRRRDGLHQAAGAARMGEPDRLPAGDRATAGLSQAGDDAGAREEMRVHLERCRDCSTTPASRRTSSACWRPGRGRQSAPASCARGFSRALRAEAEGTDPPVPLPRCVAAASRRSLAWRRRTLTGRRRGRGMDGGDAGPLRAPDGTAARCSPPSSFPAAWSPGFAPAARRSRSQGRPPRSAGRCSPMAAPRRWARCSASPDPELGLWLVTGTLAAAAADTWATSLGRRSRRPRGCSGRGRAVPPGTSGGMTLLGLGRGRWRRSAGGRHRGGSRREPVLFPVGALVGFLGMVADSALGRDAARAAFTAPRATRPASGRVHRCGTRDDPCGGVCAWLDNDG